MQLPDALASAATGMRTQSSRVDVIAENLANAGTAGYRSRRCVSLGFGERLRTASVLAQTQGALRHTGVPTDLALVGPGYFAVAAPHGVEYTRDGRLVRDGENFLCDSRGYKVLGSLGPVRLPHNAVIHSDGKVFAGGRAVDRLRIVELDDGKPRRAAASARAGFLEESGVDPISEMTALVAAERTYEANQKTAQRADEALKRAVIEVPAVRS